MLRRQIGAESVPAWCVANGVHAPDVRKVLRQKAAPKLALRKALGIRKLTVLRLEDGNAESG